MRKDTSSLAFGSDGIFGAGSGGFVVAALNAASAACRGLFALRVLSKGILPPYPRAVMDPRKSTVRFQANSGPAALAAAGKRHAGIFRVRALFGLSWALPAVALSAASLSAASLANRRAFNLAVFSRTARSSASY